MENQEQQKPLIYGILGACLGSLIGAASYILLGMMGGMYASLSSMVFAYCTLRLYRKFGGPRGTGGLLICCAAMLVMGLLGYSLDWIIACTRVYVVNFAEAFLIVFKGVIKTGEFWKGLLFLYAFIAVCTWSLLLSAKKTRRED